MRSNDLFPNMDELRQQLQTAIRNDDREAFSQVFDQMMVAQGEAVRQEYQAQLQGLTQATDDNVLRARGVRQLTSAEKEYWQKVSDAMRGANPKQAINNLDVVMPETVISSVMDDLQTNHPLLNALNFQYTGGAIRMMMNTDGYQRAQWGDLCDEIVKELFSGFKEVETGLLKLSAFIPVCQAMLNLGPAWLDRYVRAVMYEALANGLEYGILIGTGNKEPIGMVRQVGENVTVTGGVYPEKTKITVRDFSPATLGKLISLLLLTPNGKYRTSRDLILVVNPQDYFQIIMPATTLMRPDGTYANDVLPYPIRIIQSAALTRGQAVLGMGYLYFAAIGMNRNGRIEYSDDYRFLEDERVYKIKLYANGMPLDNNAFLHLDISGMEPASYRVTLVDAAEASSNADLSDLRIGSLTLSPAFATGTYTYTAATTNATNTVTATPADGGASVKVVVNSQEIDNGSAATWEDGTNTVTVTVTAENGTATKSYTVTVTKS